MELLKEYAMQFVGLPYRWAGDDAIEGFDCSGLVIELLQSYGVLPRKYDNTADGLYKKFYNEGVINSLGFGSLAFFGRSNRITHIGFMLDNTRMLEAGGGDSTTVNREKAADQNAFIRIRPIESRKDLVAIIKPRYKSLRTPR